MSMGRIAQILEWARDKLTNFQSFITGDHRYVHEGKAFTYLFNSGSVNAAASYSFAFQTPTVASGKVVHWRPSGGHSTANVASIELYRAATFTGGTEAKNSIFNRNQLKSFVTVGGNFGNQPANDGIELVSDNAADTGSVTLYGTTHGGTTVVSETISLTGTDAVSTVKTNWGLLLGVSMDAHAGTVTIREASANATIISLATGTNSAGYYNMGAVTTMTHPATIPLMFAGGASTKYVGIEYINSVGETVTEVKQLSGTTQVSFTNAAIRITKVFYGDVASASTLTFHALPSRMQSLKYDVTVATAGTLVDFAYMASGGTSTRGGGGVGPAEQEMILPPDTIYVVKVNNIGATTATIVTSVGFWYEE